MQGTISSDDPRADDVQQLLAAHWAFTRQHTPPEDIHALDLAGLLDPAVSFFSFRVDGALLGMGALKQLDAHHAELKSMHTAAPARGRGIGRAMVEHLVGVARARGMQSVSLESGSMPAFAPARALYARAGFMPCEPFADYSPSATSVFMTLSLRGLDSDSSPG